MENEFNNFNNIPPQGENEKIIGGFNIREDIFDSDTEPAQAVENNPAQGESTSANNRYYYGYVPPFTQSNQVPQYQTPPTPMQPPKQPYIPMGFTPEGYEEYKGFKKNTNAISIASIAVMLISSVWVYILYLVTGIMGISSTDVYDFISEPAMLQYISVILSTLMFTVPFIFAAKLTGHRVGDLLPMGRVNKGKALPYFLFGIGFCAFSNIATSIAGQIFSNLGIEYNVDSGDLPSGVLGFFLSVLGTALIPGFIEEFACRGIMFGILKKYGDVFAIFTTATIFGLLHGNFVQMPFAFLVGLILGLIRVKTGSMWVCFAVHAANNFVSVIFDRLSNVLSIMETNIVYMIYLIICLIVAIFGIIMLREKDEFTFEKPAHICKAAEKYKWFFASPLFIIFAVICVLESCAFFFI